MFREPAPTDPDPTITAHICTGLPREKERWTVEVSKPIEDCDGLDGGISGLGT